MKNFTKTIALLVAITLFSIAKIQAQTSIKMEIADVAKPNDLHKYTVSSTDIRIAKKYDITIADSLQTEYDNDEVQISLAFKNNPDIFIYQLFGSSKTRCKGTITIGQDDKSEIIKYEFDEARITDFADTYSSSYERNSSNSSIVITMQKLKINGVDIELIKKK